MPGELQSVLQGKKGGVSVATSISVSKARTVLLS